MSDPSIASRSRHPIASRVFHALCKRDVPVPDERTREETFAAGFPSTERFFSRLPDLELEGRSVLDFGCGMGATCFWLAEHGAARVVGVDIQEVTFPDHKLETEYAHLKQRVRFEQVTDNRPLSDPVDIVISKETFEHVIDPTGYVAAMKRSLVPGGEIVIGFGPLWKAPWGGHINFMTKVPWAHLMFPEEVILAERRRFRPDEHAERFEEIRGGLNRMTLARFLGIMDDAGLDCVSMSINPRGQTSSGLRRGVLAGMDWMRRVPVLREYVTQSVYGIWRLRDPASP